MAGTEMLPGRALVDMFKPKTAAGGLLKASTRYAVGEMAGEQVATLGQEYTHGAYIRSRDNPEWVSEYIDNIPANARSTAIASLVIGPGNVIVGSQANYARNQWDAWNARKWQNKQYAAEQAQAEHDHLQAQSEQMGQSRLATRAPDVAADYVNEVYGAQAQIYIDGDALQQSGMADKVAELMPDKADAVAEAVATGGMLELTRGDFHTVLNQPEVQSALLPHVRVRPDALTAAEAQALRDSEEGQALAQATEAAAAEDGQESAAAAEAEARKQGFAAVLDNVRQQLADTGRFTPEQAQINATLAASYYQATADRMGLAVTDLFAQRPLNVTGESLTQPGVITQALAANPPRGWVHAQDGAAAADLWNGQSKAQAVFWTDLQGKLSHDLPDMVDYSLSVSQSAIEHINKNHGNFETEAARGQIAIADTDIARLPEVVQNYDDIRFINIPGTNNKRIAFAKAFDDGVMVLLADSSKKRRDLRTVSAWKYPQSANAHNVLDYAVSLPLTSETEGGMSHADNDTADSQTTQQDILFQGVDTPQESFHATAAALGGEAAYEAAKAAGKTELTYRQWVQVRTPEFRAWFGDWENDPDNASKVVNPNTGEPLVVYHGTKKNYNSNGINTYDFTRFKAIEAEVGSSLKGFYFTDSSRVAAKFAGKYSDEHGTIYPVFLNIREPLDVDAKGNNWQNIPWKGSEVPTNSLTAFAFNMHKKGGNKELNIPAYDGAFFRNVVEGGDVVEDGDGSLIANDFVAFDGNQIKSATGNSGAFAADNDSILYQSYRRNGRDTPYNDVTHMMFADDKYSIEGYGDKLWVLDDDAGSRVDADSEAFRAAMRPWIEDNMGNLREAGFMYGEDPETFIEEFLTEANPDDIVNSAGVWDVWDTWIINGIWEEVFEPNGWNVLKTSDGAIVFDPDVVRAATEEEQDIYYQTHPRESQSPRGMFDPASDTIAILKQADASTFAHELGHFFLEMHTDLALRLQNRTDLSTGEAQLAQDVQTLMDWFGVADVAAWRSMTLSEQREYHEQFARGFEAYLYEGKAPSTALRDVFRRFAAWLQHVYRSLTALNVTLTDDVRAVYGRMLAADEAVAQAQYEHGMLPLFATAEQMGVDEAEFAQYRQTQAEAEAAAQEELRGRALRDLAFVRNLRNRVIRQMKREHKADFERAEMAARRSIMRQPVYRAWQFLTARMDEANRIGDGKEQRELRRKAKVLQGAPVFEVKQKQAPHGYPELRKWASKLFADAGGKAVNPELGEVLLNARSVKDSMGHGMNPFKAEAFAAVPAVIAQGVVIHKGVNAESQMRYAYVSAPVRIEGVDDVVTVLVRTDKNTQRMYVHSVATKESILNASDSEASAQQLQNGKVSSGYIANILRRYLTVNTAKPKNRLDNTRDSLFVAMAKLGGINKAEAVAEWGLDPKEKVAAPVFGMPLLRRDKGRTLDGMMAALAEEGYLPLDNTGKADMRDFEERFLDELRGTRRYSSAYVPQEPKKAGEDAPHLLSLTAARLDYASLVEMGFNEEALALLQQRGMVRKSGGLHPDVVAELVRDENGLPEFASGEALTLAILQAEAPQEAIEQTAYLNVLAEKGEVPTQADFEAAADVAVHSQLRTRVLAAEFKALAKATGSVRLLQRAAQAYARDKVDGMQLTDIRPARFARAQAREARLAQQALAKGDIAAAAQHKRNQLVQHALAQAALQAREDVRKMQRQLALIGRRSVQQTAKSYDANLMSAAQSVVGMFGLSPKTTERAMAYLEKVKKYDQDTFALAEGTIARAQELAYEVDGRFENLTVGAAQALFDDVMALRHLAKRMHMAVVDGKRVDIRAVQEDLRAHMATLPQRMAGKGRNGERTRSVSDAEKKMGNLYQWGAALRRVENWAEAMDGGYGGLFGRAVFQPIKDASDNYRADKAVYLQRLRDIVQGVKFGRAKIEAPELNHDFANMNEVMHALLHTGNASNKRKLLLGYGWGQLNEDGSVNTARWDAFVTRMIAEGKLTKVHFDAAQQMPEKQPSAPAAGLIGGEACWQGRLPTSKMAKLG